LTDLKFAVPRADRAHQFLVFRLSNCGDSGGERAGRDLDLLRRLRNRADYDKIPAVTEAQALHVLQLATDIIQILDQVQKAPVRTQIMNAMIEYERDVLKDVTWRP
jgi:hypothetical protein